MKSFDAKNLIPELRRFIKRFSTLADYNRAAALLLRDMSALLQAPFAVLLLARDRQGGLVFEKAFALPKKRTHPKLSADDSLHILLNYRANVFLPQHHEKYRQVIARSGFINNLAKKERCDLVVKLTVNGASYGLLIFGGPLPIGINNITVRQLLAELGERAGVTLRHARLLYSLRREALEKDLLLEIGKQINATLDLDKLLDLLLDQLHRIVPYDKGSIFLLDPTTRNIARVARRGPVPLFEQEHFIKKSEGLCTWVIKNARSVVVDDVSTDSRYYPIYLDTKSEMDIPIINRERVLGLFNLESNRKAAFSERDRRLLQALAVQAAIAIDNAWLYQQHLEKMEYERELRIAKSFQRALLPKRIPKTNGYAFAALNIPSRTVGGDIYDFIQFADGRIGMAIGDVAGKGTPGAILMATLYSTYRGLIRLPMSINEMMQELNNTLKSRISTSSFITFFYSIFDPKSGELTYCNAGHCAPILLHEDGSSEILHEGGTILGFINDLNYQVGHAMIKRSDSLFLFTDGITEAMNAVDEQFGEERLLEFLRSHRNVKPATMLRLIFRDIREFTGLNRPQDDFTAISLKGINRME